MGKAASSYLNIQMISLLAGERADMLKDDGTGTGNLVLVDSQNSMAVLFYINLELAALWDVLVSSYEDYCVYRKFIDVKANQEDYPFPMDFYKFRKVFPVVNGKRGRPLKKFNLDDLGQADSYAPLLTSPVEQSRYKVTGNRLRLHPVPTVDVTEGLELWYIPQFKYLEQAGDLIPLPMPNGWEAYVIEGVAARMLEKEESDSSAQRAEQAKVLQRILQMVEDRDVGEPFQMIDAEGYLDTTL